MLAGVRGPTKPKPNHISLSFSTITSHWSLSVYEGKARGVRSAPRMLLPPKCRYDTLNSYH